jgi:hypothetical protein
MGKLHDLAVASAPSFKCLIPSKGKMVKMRAFLVKEQKLLLIAKEAEDDKIDSILDAITHLLQNCILDNVKIDELPSFDIEYMFVQLFMHSTATKTSFAAYRCLNPVLDESGNPIMTDEGPKVCGATNKIKIDLAQAKIPTGKIKDGFITVGSESVDKLLFRYMDFDRAVRYSLAANKNDVEQIFNIIGSCMVAVYKTDGTMLSIDEDYGVEDAVELLEHMSATVFQKVMDFYSETPSLEAEHDFKCKSCGAESKLQLRGLEDFF